MNSGSAVGELDAGPSRSFGSTHAFDGSGLGNTRLQRAPSPVGYAREDVDDDDQVRGGLSPKQWSRGQALDPRFGDTPSFAYIPVRGGSPERVQEEPPQVQEDPRLRSNSHGSWSQGPPSGHTSQVHSARLADPQPGGELSFRPGLEWVPSDPAKLYQTPPNTGRPPTGRDGLTVDPFQASLPASGTLRGQDFSDLFQPVMPSPDIRRIARDDSAATMPQGAGSFVISPAPAPMPIFSGTELENALNGSIPSQEVPTYRNWSHSQLDLEGTAQPVESGMRGQDPGWVPERLDGRAAVPPMWSQPQGAPSPPFWAESEPPLTASGTLPLPASMVLGTPWPEVPPPMHPLPPGSGSMHSDSRPQLGPPQPVPPSYGSLGTPPVTLSPQPCFNGHQPCFAPGSQSFFAPPGSQPLFPPGPLPPGAIRLQNGEVLLPSTMSDVPTSQLQLPDSGLWAHQAQGPSSFSRAYESTPEKEYPVKPDSAQAPPKSLAFSPDKERTEQMPEGFETFGGTGNELLPPREVPSMPSVPMTFAQTMAQPPFARPPSSSVIPQAVPSFAASAVTGEIAAVVASPPPSMLSPSLLTERGGPSGSAFHVGTPAIRVESHWQQGQWWLTVPLDMKGVETAARGSGRNMIRVLDQRLESMRQAQVPVELPEPFEDRTCPIS